MEEEVKRHLIDRSKLPPLFPTQAHDAEFWCSLGRAVATFGFLERTLARAIFKITGTMPAPKNKAKQTAVLDKWHKKIEAALHGTLDPLIAMFQSAVRKHPRSRFENPETLIRALYKVAPIRNMLCHASWESPQVRGGTVPFYVDRKLNKFESKLDRESLDQLQRHTAELVCAVIESVTHMGYAFPGSHERGAG